MQTNLDCIPCLVRQSLEAARYATNDVSIHQLVLREVLCLARDMDMSKSPPYMSQEIHRLVRKLTGNSDPYTNVKRHFNDVSMKFYSQIREKIINSEDPLTTAVRMAIAGNIIDFGVYGKLNESDLENTISECLTADFDDSLIEVLREAVNNAGKILYIADNAGEIVFDRLLIEFLPIEKITVAVKGSPVINDATIDDVFMSGLARIVDVIDNGSDAPGTVLESCSEEFRHYFRDSDLIISKGQGNYESLSDVDKDIFFILKAKCPVIANDIGCRVGDMILCKNNY